MFPVMDKWQANGVNVEEFADGIEKFFEKWSAASLRHGGDTYPQCSGIIEYQVEGYAGDPQNPTALEVAVRYVVDSGQSVESRGYIERFGPPCQNCSGTAKVPNPDEKYQHALPVIGCPKCQGFGVVVDTWV